MPVNNYIPLLTAFVISIISTPLVIAWYTKKKWIEQPSTKHPKIIHKTPVPRGGGIAIFCSVAISSLLFLPIDQHLVGILIGGAILMITGIVDDIFDIHPKIRLGLGFLASTTVILSGIGIPYITNPFSPEVIHLDQPQLPIKLFGEVRNIWILADLFALFWITGIMNFVNWSKGLDGQLPGMVGIAAMTIAFLSMTFSADITQWSTTGLALIVAGAYFGFLLFNAYPQKIMPGYGGGALAGYFLAVLSILSTTKVGTLLVVLGIPLIDAGFVILRRIRAGQSPIWGDTRHLHHALLSLGWSKRKVAAFYWIITGALGYAALHLNSQQKFYTILLIIITLFAFILWIKQYTISSKQLDQDNG